MLKHLVAASVIAICCASAALAQPNGSANSNATANTNTAEANAAAGAAGGAQANLAPVATMTCDQMRAEMTSGGQTMSRQLDPQFGVEAQSMYNEAQQREREAMAQAPANALACLIPFVCAAAQQHQQQQAQADDAQNQARMQAQMNRLNASMNGLDQGRMRAITDRWQALHCQAPQH